MEKYIKQLRKSFTGKTDEEFAAYVYHTLQKEIDSIKKKRDKDKYIILQKQILNFIVPKGK
jgi:hypothetical protein